MTYTIFSDRTDKLLWGAGAIVVALLVLRALSLAIMRLERRRAHGERQLVRVRRGETAAALVATAIPYVAAIAVIILLASAFLPRTAAALGGSALVLILVGFGAQRFLTDVIAGALIAFERWYGIGDFVKVEPAQASGLVEQFGFRSTVLRSLNGDRTYIPNSQIVAATRSPRGYRRYSIELLTSDPEETRRAIERASTATRRSARHGSYDPHAWSRNASSERAPGSFAARPTSRRRWNGWPKVSSSPCLRRSYAASRCSSSRSCTPSTKGRCHTTSDACLSTDRLAPPGRR